MSEFDPFEREFRRQTAGLRRTPSPRSWSRIERRLDRRSGGGHILGIRPWMIAALVLLMAGTFAISGMGNQQSDVLAQRAESIQELSTPYVPEEVFVPKEYTGEETEEVEHGHDFRDVTVAKKHRIAG